MFPVEVFDTIDDNILEDLLKNEFNEPQPATPEATSPKTETPLKALAILTQETAHQNSIQNDKPSEHNKNDIRQCTKNASYVLSKFQQHNQLQFW